MLHDAPLFYLELNDDALIRDIVSGVYTGTPEAHNIQNLYPFGALVAGLYKILPNVPWYGGILFFLQILAVAVILVTTVRAAGRGGLGIPGRVLAGLSMVSVFVLMLPHFFFVQYSVTAGLLAAAAAYLLMVSRDGRSFFGAVILTGLAYIIRSELLLLLLPMLFLALLFSYTREIRCSREENEALPGLREFLTYPFKTDHYRRFGLTFVGLFLSIAVGFTTNRLGYADTAWNDFVEFFDARTEVYDYTGVPSYEGHEGIYESLRLSREEAALFENYNFGLDTHINANIMRLLASAAGRLLPPASTRLKAALEDAFYRMHHLGFPEDFTWPQTDAPWNVLVIILYVAAFVLALFSDRYRQQPLAGKIGEALWKPMLLFICRSVLWIWLLYGARDPVRVTHPLYFMEFFILTGMVLTRLVDERRHEEIREENSHGEENKDEAKKRFAVPGVAARFACLAAGLVLLLGVIYAAPTVRMIRQEQEKRAEVNKKYETLRSYCRKNGRNNVYFLDVYSSVSETRPLFKEADKTHRPDNLDLLGGWAVKSPAWRDKLDAFGMDDAASGLLSDSGRFVARSDMDVTWLSNWYASEGIPVTVTVEDTLEDVWTIYRVSAAEDADE